MAAAASTGSPSLPGFSRSPTEFPSLVSFFWCCCSCFDWPSARPRTLPLAIGRRWLLVAENESIGAVLVTQTLHGASQNETFFLALQRNRLRYRRPFNERFASPVEDARVRHWRASVKLPSFNRVLPDEIHFPGCNGQTEKGSSIADRNGANQWKSNTNQHAGTRNNTAPFGAVKWIAAVSVAVGSNGFGDRKFFFFENANVRPFRFLFFTKTKPTRTQSRRPNDPQPSPPCAAFEFRGCLAALALDGGVRGPAGVSERHSTSAVMMMMPSGRVSYLAEG